MRCLTRLVVLATFILSCGGQWSILQGLAWGNMICTYAERVSVSQAVTMTFDGHHLCPLCRAIAAKKKAENKAVAVLPTEKKICWSNLVLAVPRIETAPVSYTVCLPRLHFRSDAPPTPPPRTV